jgi:hypothetical protein
MRGLISLASLVPLLALTVVCSADSLPPQFLGNWESLPLPDVSENSEYLKLACKEREGVVISRKNIVWNTEGDCDIDDVKPSHAGNVLNTDHVAVSLTCYEREGRQVPLKVRSLEIWSLVKIVFFIDKNTIMSQTSMRNVNTSFFQKCD